MGFEGLQLSGKVPLLKGGGEVAVIEGLGVRSSCVRLVDVG